MDSAVLDTHPFHVPSLRLRRHSENTNTLHRHILALVPPTEDVCKATLVVQRRLVTLDPIKNQRARKDIVFDCDLQREPFELDPGAIG